MGDLISWLTFETQGICPRDGLLLMSSKLAYLFVRLLLRISIGKKRRDTLLLSHKLDFNYFMYIFLKLFRLQKSLVGIYVPVHDYKFWCRINREDFTFMTIHKDDIIEHFRPKKGDVVVDVGAHTGLYTIIASKGVGISGRVISIEPHPQNFEILNRNIELNNLTNTITLNYGAYSSKANLNLYLPEEQHGFTIYNTLMPERAKGVDKFVKVNTETLDTLLAFAAVDCKDVNWVKIDVEGAELEVLKGAAHTLSEAQEISVLVEVHGFENYPPLKALLKSYGFHEEYETSNREGDWGHILLRKRLCSAYP
jgi:FkbM family methyltransferase